MKTKESHESYGILQISRTSNGQDTALFGSSIPHKNTIRLSIFPGVVERDLNKDWFHDEGPATIDVEMSQAQFAEAITSLNFGAGTPVTIRRIDGKRVEDPPFISKRQQFENEFKQQMQNIEKQLSALTSQAEDVLQNKKSITKGDRETILKQLRRLKMEIGSNVPFIASSYNEQLDKTTTEAKGEIEAFTANKLNQLGLAKLHELQQLPEQKEETPWQKLNSPSKKERIETN